MDNFVKSSLLFLGGFVLGRAAAKMLGRKSKRNFDYLTYGHMSGADFDGDHRVIFSQNY